MGKSNADNSGKEGMAFANTAKVNQRIKRQSLFLEEYVKSGFNISRTLEKIGITRITFRTWMNNRAKVGEGFTYIDDNGEETPALFSERFENLEESLIDNSEEKLMQRINSGDTIANIFHLKTKGKHRGWVENTKYDVNVEIGMSKEAKDAITRAAEEDAVSMAEERLKKEKTSE